LVSVTNVVPTATLSVPATVNEGETFTLALADLTDPSAADATAGFTYTFDCGDGTGVQNTGDVASINCVAPDVAGLTVTATITDKDGGKNSYTATIVVNNVAPTVGAIRAPVDPQAVGTSVNASASFTDPGIGLGDTHAAAWDWGDGTTSAGSVTESSGTGSVSGSHTYTTAGVYTISLTVTDKDGATGSSVYQFVVVYDANAGFVTGGGWITSPAGAYQADPGATGKATFGFVSKYKKGANVPTGNTEFQFHAAGLDFQSTSYQWLVISGPHAQFKGVGAINGAGEYGFMITAVDGQINGGGGADSFRIKIWAINTDGSDGGVVYDNGAQTPLGGGSIIIHGS
jgi:hypothetical protein